MKYQFKDTIDKDGNVTTTVTKVEEVVKKTKKSK